MGKVGSFRRLSRVAILVGLTAVLVGVPLAASANPDVSGFELDGNAASGGGGRLGVARRGAQPLRA